MGIDWSSAATQATIRNGVHQLDIVLFGIILWECVVTIGFDWSVLSRKRPFAYPVVLYWCSKWGALLFIICVNIPTFKTSHAALACQSLGNFLDFMARLSMASASALFMLRTIALWFRDQRVIIPLVAAHLGQIGLYLHNVFIVKEHWGGSSCIVDTVTWGWLKIQFIYTMAFDGLVLALACYALFKLHGRSNLGRVLFVDGLSYYCIAFSCYLTCTILAYLGVSIVLSFGFSDTSTILTSIAACRSFVRVYTHSFNEGSNVYVAQDPDTRASTKIAFRSNISSNKSYFWTRPSPGPAPPPQDISLQTLPANRSFESKKEADAIV